VAPRVFETLGRARCRRHAADRRNMAICAVCEFGLLWTFDDLSLEITAAIDCRSISNRKRAQVISA
jgi:hypothetical protein